MKEHMDDYFDASYILWEQNYRNLNHERRVTPMEEKETKKTMCATWKEIPGTI